MNHLFTRRTLFTGALAAGSVAALGACTKKDASAQPGKDEPATIGLTYIPNVQFSPFYVALDKGLFKDSGFAVKLRHHGQQEDLFGALLKRTEDVVFASADEAVVAASKGQDLAVFATAYQTYPIELISLGRGGGMPAYAGRKVGIPGHYGANYYAALVMLAEAGMTEKDVQLVDIGYTQTQALSTGKVDAILGFSNNESVQLVASGKTIHTNPVTDPDKPSIVGPSLIAQKSTASKDFLSAVAKAMKEAEEMIITDPQVALDATAKQVPALADKAQMASAKAVLEATMKLWTKGGKIDVSVDKDAMKRMSAAFLKAKVIETEPELPVMELA